MAAASYIAMMIKDFGGYPEGMTATTDTNYVIVGQPPRGRAKREFYDKQLKEADTLELPLLKIDKLMKQIGGKDANIHSVLCPTRLHRSLPVFLGERSLSNLRLSLFDPLPERSA